MAQDWLGQEVNIGDYIVYPAQSGRCTQMTVAKVAEFKDNGNVVVEPAQSARWKQHHPRTKYIDRRTGKGINPFADKHIESGGYAECVVTGARLDDQYRADDGCRDGYAGNRNYHVLGKYRYVPVRFKDYVEQVQVTRTRVTLSANAKSITKVNWQPEAGTAG